MSGPEPTRRHSVIPMTEEDQARFWSLVKTGPECWEWLGSRSNYGLFRPRGEQKYGAHRIALQLSGGAVGPGCVVCHTCDNPYCVRPSHLYAGTNRTNAEDFFSRHVRSPKLTPEAAMAMRTMRSQGATVEFLMSAFGKKRSAVYKVLGGRTFPRLPEVGV
jgi:hypothetical protein